MYDDHNNFSRIYSGYKLPTRPDHYGIDIVGRLTSIDGVVINSVCAGKVIIGRDGYHDSAGNYVVVEADDYDPIELDKKLYVRYMHLKDNPDLKPGDRVSVGTTIGRTDSTGNSSGPHLHFDVNKGYHSQVPASAFINPQRFFPRIKFVGDLSSQ